MATPQQGQSLVVTYSLLLIMVVFYFFLIVADERQKDLKNFRESSRKVTDYNCRGLTVN